MGTARNFPENRRWSVPLQLLRDSLQRLRIPNHRIRVPDISTVLVVRYQSFPPGIPSPASSFARGGFRNFIDLAALNRRSNSPSRFSPPPASVSRRSGRELANGQRESGQRWFGRKRPPRTSRALRAPPDGQSRPAWLCAGAVGVPLSQPTPRRLVAIPWTAEAGAWTTWGHVCRVLTASWRAFPSRTTVPSRRRWRYCRPSGDFAAAGPHALWWRRFRTRRWSHIPRARGCRR